MLNKKKTDTKGHTLYNSIYMKCSESASLQTEGRQVVVRGYREGKMEKMDNGYNVCFWGDCSKIR